MTAETLDSREHHICQLISKRISSVLGGERDYPFESLPAITRMFDEAIVADHLEKHHGLRFSVADVLNAIHSLAEQTYENKALAFGCIFDPSITTDGLAEFPRDYIKSKKFKALSDGFRTAYVVSRNGGVVRFVDLENSTVNVRRGNHFFPDWAESFSKACREPKFGIILTRHGDVLIFDQGTLRFTYRFGKWQYWNHAHLVNLIRDRARAQRVPKSVLGNVVGAIYRTALDVSFRRSGALILILHNQNSLNEVVKFGDELGHSARSRVEQEFDQLVRNKTIQSLPRTVVAELAALDGAIVINNSGSIRSYGAVLQPRKSGKLVGTEGSRTKAAIGASNYGLAVKISSDGDITVFHDGREYIRI